MHRKLPPHGLRFLAQVRRRSSQLGFSLIEITLAIGIIAFAFVALFGLLPVGLTVFRGSIDTTNQMWIVQNLNSMVQVTEWPQVRKLGYDISREIYYFDEEGRRTDSELHPSQDSTIVNKRLYAVKLVMDDFARPKGDGNAGAGAPMPDTLRITVVFAQKENPTAMRDFNTVSKPEEIAGLPVATQVRVRSFLATKMDSAKDL